MNLCSYEYWTRVQTSTRRFVWWYLFRSTWHSSAVFKCKGVNEKRSSISQELQEAANVPAKIQSLVGKTAAGKRRRIWETRSCCGRTTVALEKWTLGEELFATRNTLQLKLPNRIDLHIYIVGAGAWIPYKRGDDDVGWFICYRYS